MARTLPQQTALAIFDSDRSYTGYFLSFHAHTPMLIVPGKAPRPVGMMLYVGKVDVLFSVKLKGLARIWLQWEQGTMGEYLVDLCPQTAAQWFKELGARTPDKLLEQLKIASSKTQATNKLNRELQMPTGKSFAQRIGEKIDKNHGILSHEIADALNMPGSDAHIRGIILRELVPKGYRPPGKGSRRGYYPPIKP